MKKQFALVLALSLSATSAWAEEASALWEARCKSCHGMDGRAQTKMGQRESIADMTSAEWQKGATDKALREVIAEGSKKNKKMKAYKDKLTPEQIDALVKHIRTFKAE